MTSLLFIPGAGSDAQDLQKQILVFGDRYECSAIDLTDLDSIEAMVNRVLNNAPERFILCGASMGGYVSLALARQAADRLQALILLNTSARADTPERQKARKIEVDKGEAFFLAERHRDEYFAQFLSPMHAEDQSILDDLRATALRAGFQCFRNHQMACGGRASSLDILSNLNVPTLVVGGANDTLIPPVCQREIAQNIPEATLVILENCGHIAHLEQPNKLNSVIGDFLKANGL